MESNIKIFHTYIKYFIFYIMYIVQVDKRRAGLTISFAVCKNPVFIRYYIKYL